MYNAGTGPCPRGSDESNVSCLVEFLSRSGPGTGARGGQSKW